MIEVATRTENRARFNWRLLFSVLAPGPIAGMVAALILSVTAFANLQVYNLDPAIPELTYYMGLHGVLLFGALMGGTWGLLPMLLLGLSAHAWLLRRTHPAIWMYAIAAMAAGIVFGGLTGWNALSISGANGLGVFASYLGAGACAGLVAGVVFWLIRRPDRDAVSARPEAS